MTPTEAATDPDTHRIVWADHNHFEVDGTRFVASGFQADDADAFLVIKPPDLVRRYLDLVAEERPRRIVELGVKDGGSTALLSLVADPELLIAIDLELEVPTALADLIEAQGLGGRVLPRPGIDQADRVALLSAVDAATAGRPLDLVIDDASHLLMPTERSFDALFPRVRPGGAYIIEDWCAEYHTAQVLATVVDGDTPDFSQRLSRLRTLFALLNSPTADLPPEVIAGLTEAAARIPEAQSPADVALDGAGRLLARIAEVAAATDLSMLDDAPRSLTDLSVSLMLAAAAHRDVIAEVRVDSHWLLVRRGPAPLDPDTFLLGELVADHFGYLPPT